MTIIDILLDSLSKQEEKFGKDSDYVAKTCQQLGEFYLEEQQYDLASNYFKRALEIRINLYMPNSPEVSYLTNAVNVTESMKQSTKKQVCHLASVTIFHTFA